MHIKSIQLEGFKSYAQKTIINEFDSQFNAITGLNGSGKSNILDAILFVLGLSQYSIARVGKMQELIYKGGQAGITKASVSICFDNTNNRQSPSGYEQFDEIIVTRQITSDKSKYFVNGVTETPKKIKNLFRSVQLNIDNPHFLVAQGKITKIINLKPKDLTGMLEETAGTSLYLDKKTEGLKLIKKKEDKILKMEQIIKEEIEPGVLQIKKERQMLQEFTDNQSEMKQLEKQLIQYRFNELTKNYEENRKRLENIKQMIQNEKNQKKKLEKEIEIEQEKYKQLVEESKKQMVEGSIQQEYEKKKKEVNIKEEKGKLDREQLEQSEKDIDKIKSQLNTLKSSGPLLKGRVERLKQDQVQAIAEKERLSNQIQDLQQAKDALSKGQDYSQQYSIEEIQKTTQEQYESNMRQMEGLKQKVQQMNRKLEENERQSIGSQEDRTKASKQVKDLKRETEELQDKMKAIIVDEQTVIRVKEDKQQLQRQAQQLEGQIQNYYNKYWQLKLQYNDPEPKFDRKRVLGRLFSLFQIKDRKNVVAIESIAGGRLNNIVVDNQHTASLILKNDSFRQHVNLMPINKIQGYAMKDSIRSENEQVADNKNGSAVLAVQLIRYDPCLENVMQFVFGSTFVVSSSQVGQAIANQPNSYSRRRCVNQEGDIFDTTGSLSGGYVNTQKLFLNTYQDVLSLQNQFSSLSIKITQNHTLFQEHQETLNCKQSLNNRLQDKQKRLEQVKEDIKLHQNNNSETNKQALLEQKTDLEEQLATLQKRQTKIQNDLEGYHKMASEQGGSQDKKKLISQSLEKLFQQKKESETEIENMKHNLQQYNGDVGAQEQELERQEKKHCRLQEVYIEQKESRVGEQRILEEEKEILSSLDSKVKEEMASHAQTASGLSHLEETVALKETKKEELEKSVGLHFNKQEQLRRQVEIGNKDLCDIQRTHPGLALNMLQDMHYFDFSLQAQKMQEMKNKHEYLRKHIDFKDTGLSSKVEQDYEDNKQRVVQLHKDKGTIIEDITQLDAKRATTLQQCYQEVTKSMSAIFSVLLKGAQVKLLPVQEGLIEEGLEIHVGFGKKWVTGLTELSGGQRSLLALSFLLSLLKYKPAPFYILDEIDAALDSSHTENIGAMIQQYFPQSQFIIISLKEGMFNHANTLFKTTFNDGISKVDRFQIKKKKDEINQNKRKNR